MKTNNKKVNKTIFTLKEWLVEGTRLFGKDKKKWKFKCVSCGNIQSIEDFEKLEIKEPETKMFFSCIGRWIKNSKGELGNKQSPCNYTLGGLFTIGDYIEVLDEKGNTHNVFPFARKE